MCLHVYTYMHKYIYIYIGSPNRPAALRGNHSSNTTCLTLVFFESGEYFGK